MPRRSKVMALPAPVRARLEALIVERGFADYTGLADWLTAQGHDVGRMSLQRHGSKIARRIEKLRLATEQAEALVAAAPDDAGAMADASLRMAQERIFELMVAAEDGDLKELSSVAKALAETARASLAIRAERRKVLAETGKAVGRALDDAEKAAQGGGNPMEVIRRVRREVYGIFDD